MCTIFMYFFFKLSSSQPLVSILFMLWVKSLSPLLCKVISLCITFSESDLYNFVFWS